MNANRILGLFGLVVSVIYLFSAVNLPSASLSDPIGPKGFPILLSVLGIIVSVIILFQHKFVKDIKEINLKVNKEQMKMIIYTVVLCVLYALVFDTVGFLVSTILFLFGVLFKINENKLKQNIIISVSFGLGLYIVFAKMLSLSLPRGFFYF